MSGWLVLWRICGLVTSGYLAVTQSGWLLALGVVGLVGISLALGTEIAAATRGRTR